jgi:hypothetical protein
MVAAVSTSSALWGSSFRAAKPATAWQGRSSMYVESLIREAGGKIQASCIVPF